MTHSIIKKVPGKLFLAGEYAVTIPNHLSIIAPVPRFLTVTLTPSDDNFITSSQTPTYVEWARHCGTVVPLSDNPFHIVTKTIEVTEQYIREQGFTIKNFELHISSDLDDLHSGKKFGLGSSGAVTVATIQALLEYYTIATTPELVFKLSAIVHLALNSNGSFGDLATCAYQHVIVYTSLDKQWLLQQLDVLTISQMVDLQWQYMSITPLKLPDNIGFLVGWSGSPASSEQLVAHIIKQKHTPFFTQFLKLSDTCVLQFIDGITSNNINKITSAIIKNRQLLQQLSPLIETSTLQTMLTLANNYNAIGKTSGAGGGDCAYVLVTNTTQQTQITQLWQQNHITPLFTLGTVS